MAGYSLGEADLLRRAMGKKKVSEMQKHRGIFVKGASDRGVDKKVADELFDQMVLFAEYCFNKSHSTAYGAVTYQTAYLKAHYPVAYMAALLTVMLEPATKCSATSPIAMQWGLKSCPPISMHLALISLQKVIESCSVCPLFGTSETERSVQSSLRGTQKVLLNLWLISVIAFLLLS